MDSVSNYRFVFTYGGFKAGFKRFSNLCDRVSFGDDERHKSAYPIRNLNKAAGKVILEKGCGMLHPLSDSLNGFKGFIVGMRIVLPCSIIEYDANKAIKRCIVFDNGIVSTYECGTLDAVSGEILIDKLVIEHNGLVDARAVISK